MMLTSSHELGALSDALRRVRDFIVVGEMHGSKQNAPLIQELLSIILTKSKPVTIAFEWTLSGPERDALRGYIHGGEVPAQLPTFFLDSDGRFTYEHVSLLKWIRTYNASHNNLIDLHTFDNSISSAEPEQAMANSLRDYKKDHLVSIILVETGNMHARNSSYAVMGTEYLSMAALLKKDYAVLSIFLRYVRGEILVEGENRDVTKATSQQEGPGSYFDATIDISLSEAVQNPGSLTEIARSL